MRYVKKFISSILCLCLLLTSYTLPIKAAEQDERVDVKGVATYTDATNTDAQISEDYNNDISSEYRLNWLVVGQDYIEAPSEQYVLADIGNEGTVIESAKLMYVNKTTGAAYEVEANFIQGTSIVFYIEHNSEDHGIYELHAIDYMVDGKLFSINIHETGFKAKYGVNTEVDVEPTAWIIDEESVSNNADITILDSNGNAVTEASVEDLLNGQAVQTQELQPSGASATGETVIVLSPGHGEGTAGASTPGTIRTWDGVTYVERDLALKIANYCKEELEKKSGIKVYMTRYDSASELSIEGRVQYAKSLNADLYVSIHLNSTDSNSTTAHGAEVLIPSENYNPDQHKKASELGQYILNRLAELGLTNRGKIIRYSENGTTYADGSLADYYGEVKYCKLNNIPGVIVEHAFLNNPDEAKKYLGSEQALKSLGIADAKGILDYIDNNHTVTITSNANAQRVDISAQYIGDNVYQYRFLVYNLQNKQWELISDWSNKSTVQWKPEKGEYWIQAEVGMNGNRIAYNTVTYKSEINYKKNYVKLNGYTFSNTDTSVRAGVNYVTNEDNVKFRWLAYNLSTQKWELIKDWTSGNWMNWKPAKGSYWLRVEAMSSDGSTGSYTEVYTAQRDYGQGFVDFLRYVTIENTNFISVGIAYNTNVDNLEFRWLAYNLTTQKWELIKDWSTGNWMNWQPNKGDYWLRVECRSADGAVEENYTEIYKSVRDYNEKYIRLNGICIDKRNTVIAAGAVYESNAKNVKFRWLAYNLSTQKWELIQDWTSGNWMNWKPSKGSYWLRVEAKASEEIESNYTITYVSDIDYNHSYITINNVDISENKTSYTLKANYNTNSNTVKFRWLVYNLYNKEWKQLSDWNDKETIDWEPDTGNDYWIRLEVKTDDGNTDIWCKAYQIDKYSIVGKSSVTVQQMVSYYNANATYPAFYTLSDAPTLEQFCQIYLEECEAEGIKTEVAFCQAMKETGFLRYGGIVNINQYNFAGIGASGAGATSASFSSVREGIRAQVQHLKAYASKDNLNNTCVDPRYSLVNKGTAPYVEWLGINENPYGCGWATAINYGYSIKKDYISRLLQY